MRRRGRREEKEEKEGGERIQDEKAQEEYPCCRFQTVFYTQSS